ncbi:MAG: hypothetical protein JXA42_12515, partial [Anaerolineales bacterium]|nr:hypothetical protein [Anaerolineales bacterium]
MRFFLDAIGCRLNHSEMERLARKFTGQGHVIVRDPALADICILNTCAVTADAERKSRQAANRIARQNPGAQIVLTGCYVTLSPNDTCLDNFSHIVCNKDKPFIPTILGIDDPLSSPCWYLPKGRTRAFVQVQDGCDNRCTYCVTTIARGPSVSRPVTEI